jgi:hypothetical protein
MTSIVSPNSLRRASRPLAELVGLVGSHAGGRLVEQQDVGVGGQRAAELEQLERAVGLAADALVAHRLQPEHVEDGVGPLGQLLLGRHDELAPTMPASAP